MTWFFIFVLTLYCMLLLILILGWNRVLTTMKFETLRMLEISIVVPCRNEAQNLETLVKSLSGLSYPTEKYEVLLVNDHSTDDTLEKMQALSGDRTNFRTIDLPAGKEGKKQALAAGIHQASHRFIVTTDADCTHPPQWLGRISEDLLDSETKMIVGPVKLSINNTFFSSLQAVEFSSLVGVSAASIGLGHPVMCNGANLAFNKKAFTEVGGYEDNLGIASGDDEFLMRKILKKYPRGVRFVSTAHATVTSQPQKTLREFIHQRLRWAGKWSRNSDLLAKTLAVFIILTQVAFVWLVAVSVSTPGAILALVGAKVLLEAVFLGSVGRWLGQGFKLAAFILLQVLYPVYSIGVGLLSFALPFTWKSRNYK